MLCEICKKNEANMHITRVINGAKHDLYICERCAKEKEELNLGSYIDFSSPFTFQNILSGIMDYIGSTNEKEKSCDITCSNCGTTFSEFRKKGFLGCSQCYENFSSIIMPIVKQVQGNVEHTGKIPQKAGKDIIEKKQLIRLKEELQKSIATEEYEKAAEIRDKIKEIEKDKNKR